MKVTGTSEKDEFKPISITITLESQEEYDEFFVIFNHYLIINALPHIDHKKIRETLKDFHPKKSYGNFEIHSKLCDSFRSYK